MCVESGRMHISTHSVRIHHAFSTHSVRVHIEGEGRLEGKKMVKSGISKAK